MRPITKAQQRALRRVWLRTGWARKPASYLAFRRSAFVAFGDCVMVPWCGMLLGIEPDGHIHS